MATTTLAWSIKLLEFLMQPTGWLCLFVIYVALAWAVESRINRMRPRSTLRFDASQISIYDLAKPSYIDWLTYKARRPPEPEKSRSTD